MVSRKKTEELVGSVFADHFDCEVRMVGKSHDKGVDLVLVRGDKVTALVQVKHRDKNSRNWRAEPVSTVREFLGAFMLAKSQHAILVTTARRFSREAKEAAAQSLTLSSVHQYDLMDGAELLRTLRLTSDRVREQWRDNLFFTVK
jgi:predicted helicase